jgi:GTP cyclohydrolase I
MGEKLIGEYGKDAIAACMRAVLYHLGDDPKREGLLETPDRIARAMVREWFSGYAQDPDGVLTVFEDGGDQMILCRDIAVYSHCEHHMAPFFGVAHIAYVPKDGRILGLSKLARVTDIYARRLQIQERLTEQIAEALWTSALDPLGVGVVLSCRHLCMESRGIRRPGTKTITSALRGCFEDQEARAEFLGLIGR